MKKKNDLNNLYINYLKEHSAFLHSQLKKEIEINKIKKLENGNEVTSNDYMIHVIKNLLKNNNK